MSGQDEEVVRAMEGARAVGRPKFTARLKKDRGRYRLKPGPMASRGKRG